MDQLTSRNRPVEEVALERYGSLDEYHEALEERRVLDDRDARKTARRGTDGLSTPSTAGMRTPGGPEGSSRKYMFSGGEDSDGYFSRPASRSGFRRPGEAADSTPGPAGAGSRVAQMKRQESGYSAPPKVSTPIPSVFTPVISRGQSMTASRPEDAGTTSRAHQDEHPVLSIAELNRMQAAVLRAKLSDDANAAELEEEYEYERMRYESGAGRKDDGRNGMYEGGVAGLQGQMGREDEYDERGNKIEVQVLPTLDGRGRLYDVGQGRDDGYQDYSTAPGGKKKRKKEPKVCRVSSKCGRMLMTSLTRTTNKAISFDTMQTTMSKRSESWSGKSALAVVLESRKCWMPSSRVLSLGMLVSP